MSPRYEVVVPTSGRPSLRRLLDGLAAGGGPWPQRVILVDDRRDPEGPLPVPELPVPVAVVRGPARGPAAARNAGWRAGSAPWVAFLDDDVVPPAGWRAALAADLERAGDRTGAVQGGIRVPLPAERAPTDWERNVAGLERARWATADMAYRREALAAVGGFDERFPRAYREDADLGLRVIAAGWEIAVGERAVAHPVPPARASVSLAKQAGNADDVLMRALHGRDWRERAGVPRGRRPRHLAVAAAGVTAVAAEAAARLRPTSRWRNRTATARLRAASRVAGAAWLAGTTELACARIAPGPRTPREVAAMAWTSTLMPFAATGWFLRGLATVRRRAAAPARPAAVLFDRDGTLVVDVPYNGDPARVETMPAARPALERLRAAGIPTGVVSNQSGVARGMLTADEVERVNRRVEELLGPLGPWAWCPHGPEDGCECRKPAPGLVLQAASALGVDPAGCVVVGDIGADVEAARAAGARGMLVPTPRTRPEEIAAAPEVARDLEEAVERLLSA
jgi:histidinol-phosphate phosphatase family protein